MRNANQEFSCQSLESFSREYHNMENKIFGFKFEPVRVKLFQIIVLEATKTKQKSSMTNWIHKNGATVKNVKRCQPV